MRIWSLQLQGWLERTGDSPLCHFPSIFIFIYSLNCVSLNSWNICTRGWDMGVAWNPWAKSVVHRIKKHFINNKLNSTRKCFLFGSLLHCILRQSRSFSGLFVSRLYGRYRCLLQNAKKLYRAIYNNRPYTH